MEGLIEEKTRKDVLPLEMEDFALRVEALRPKLYRTAFCYLGSEAAALDVLDEAVYRGLKNRNKLRQPEYFDTWMTRILLNECSREQKRRSRFRSLEEVRACSQEDLDDLSLNQAVQKLPKELKDVVILRFFSGYTQAETALALEIPQGTVATRQRKALQLLKLDLEETSV